MSSITFARLFSTTIFRRFFLALIRAKLIDDENLSSSYRALEVLDELKTQPENHVEALAIIPDLCLERHADEETMGVREILDVEGEKQSNGKVFKKV